MWRIDNGVSWGSAGLQGMCPQEDERTPTVSTLCWEGSLKTNGQDQETGFKHLCRIYKAVEQAALSSPWAKDPYVVMRRTKAEGSQNSLPTRRALKILRKVDPMLHRIAEGLERQADCLWLKERKCTECGLLYEPVPEGDTGLCILCIMEVKKA